MTGEIIIGIVCLVVVALLYSLLISERKSHAEKEKDLLNRIMSRNYETFVQGEVAMKEPVITEHIPVYEEGLPVY